MASSIEIQISPTDSKVGFPGKVITSVELGSPKKESCRSFIEASSTKAMDKVPYLSLNFESANIEHIA